MGSIRAACGVADIDAFQTTEEALLDKARRGEQRAQRELFRAHEDRVAKQVQWMTGDASAVDDLVQEVFVAAFCALTTFRGEARVETWLHAIAANKVRNWWDANRRRESRELVAASQAREEPHTPEESLETTEHRRRLYAALGDLPHELREAFTLRAIEHRSLRQVSEVLGVPISTVSYRARRAEQLLCQALGLST